MPEQFLQGEYIPSIPEELDRGSPSKTVRVNLGYSGVFAQPGEKVCELPLREWSAIESQEQVIDI